MKKKTVKKLMLAKETLRGLTDDLEQAVGAYPTETVGSCGCYSFVFACDPQETAHPTCVA